MTKNTTGNLMAEYLQGRMTRTQLLKAAVAGLAVAAVPSMAGATGRPPQSFPFYPQTGGTYAPESISDILNALSTVGHFATTALSVVLTTPDKYGLSGLGLTISQAVIAEEQFHIDFLATLGAVPVTLTFTTPPDAGSTPQAALASSEISATIQVAMWMTAVREFAELGQPELAKWAYQAGAQEAEQRATFRFLQILAGVTTAAPPNNKAFETDLFLHIGDALRVYRALGFIGGSGIAVSYPGRDAVLGLAGPMAAAVTQKMPNNAGSTVTLTGPASLTGERA